MMSAPVAAAPGDTADGVDEASGGSTVSQDEQPSSGQRWSEDDWRLWNAGQWPTRAMASPTPTVYEASDGAEQQAGTRQRTSWWSSSTATTWEDPWTRWRDPWSSGRSDEVLDERGGGTDKIAVPEFSGEDDRDGCKAKSYLRKVQAWRRVTRLKPHKQALVLYNGLFGKAWRDAEEIDLAALDSPNGVDVFMQWITEHYLDKEIVKAGKYMSDFFKHYKRGHAQDIRDFMEFDRHISN